jgi:pre-mRNA-processing factor 19
LELTLAPLVLAYTTCRFHPDGLILGTGTSDSRVRLWDIKAQSNVATFSHSSGRISALAFSENGYTVATGSDSEGVVRIWDLRKLEQVSAVETGGKGVQCVAFDWSGQYLAVAAGGNVGWVARNSRRPNSYRF